MKQLKLGTINLSRKKHMGEFTEKQYIIRRYEKDGIHSKERYEDTAADEKNWKSMISDNFLYLTHYN